MFNTARRPVGAVSPFSKLKAARLTVMFIFVVVAATAVTLSRITAAPAAGAPAELTVIDNTGHLGADSYGATVRIDGPGGFTAQCDNGFYPQTPTARTRRLLRATL